MNSALITICIPAYNRPEMCVEAVKSCFLQTYRPLEIIIGDDSSNNLVEHAFKNIQLPEGVTLKYHRNIPALGQSENTNDLFEKAFGSRLLILHDDDLLCENGIDLLDKCWSEQQGVKCVYGKPYIISNSGILNGKRTLEYNSNYFRTADFSGKQTSAIAPGLWQQIPNDCFLVDSEIARNTGYRSYREVGLAADADFGIRIGLAAGPGSLVYLDEYISKYRITDVSQTNSGNMNINLHLFYLDIQKLKTTGIENDAKDIALGRIGPQACLAAAMSGQKKLALSILFSKHYKRAFLSKWSLFRIICIISSPLGRFIEEKVRQKRP